MGIGHEKQVIIGYQLIKSIWCITDMFPHTDKPVKSIA